MRKLLVCLFVLCLLAYSTSSWAASLRLTWTDLSDNEVDFRVERSLNTAVLSFVQIATTAANVATYTDALVVEGTSYAFRVKACNSAGCSSYSNTAVGVAPVSLPTTPSGLTATPLP